MTREHISLSRVFWYSHVYMEMVIILPVGRYGFWNLVRTVLAQDSHGRSILISDQFQKSFHSKESTTSGSKARPVSLCWVQHWIYDRTHQAICVLGCCQA